MSAIPTERKAQFLRKLFEILAQIPDGLQAEDTIEQPRREIPPTEYEQRFYESGPQRFEKIVRSPVIPTVKAGWMVKSKGLWLITETGSAALRQHPNPGSLLRDCEINNLQRAKRLRQLVLNEAFEDSPTRL